MTQIQEVSKCYWKNGAARLAWHRVATNLPFVKKKRKKEKALSVKHNKMRYACNWLLRLRGTRFLDILLILLWKTDWTKGCYSCGRKDNSYILISTSAIPLVFSATFFSDSSGQCDWHSRANSFGLTSRLQTIKRMLNIWDTAGLVFRLGELKTYVHMKPCMQMFITASFIIAKTWKQPRCPSVGEWINKLCSIQTADYY